MDNCKDLASGTRYNLIIHKIKLYRAFLAMDYKNLREEELQLGFLLAQDADLQAIFEEAVNRERNASSGSLFIPNPGEPVPKECKDSQHDKGE